MDGAVEAGERAARQVLHSMNKICQDEIFQTEPPSKDIPPVYCGLTTLQLWLPSVPAFLTILTFLGVSSIFGIGYVKRCKA